MSTLAIDFGAKRIGVAVSYYNQLVKPVGVYFKSEFLSQIEALAAKEEVTKVVIGLPAGKLQKQILNFGKQLEKKLNIKPVFVDETLTTVKAISELNSKGVKRKKRRQKEHAFAACKILEEYLETNEKLVN